MTTNHAAAIHAEMLETLYQMKQLETKLLATSVNNYKSLTLLNDSLTELRDQLTTLSEKTAPQREALYAELK